MNLSDGANNPLNLRFLTGKLEPHSHRFMKLFDVLDDGFLNSERHSADLQSHCTLRSRCSNC